MNLYSVFNEIQKVDGEVYEKLDTRRSAMKSFAGLAGKLALTAVPIALGSMLNKAFAGSKNVSDVLGVLNYALKLEYLESEFYTMGLSKGASLIPTADTAAFQKISNDETAHVNFLKAAITAAGGTPVAKPAFDFTAKGTFADVFTNYSTFLAVSQTFEDTGVRAYKGRAGELVKTDALTAALKIHAVEARHAAHVRLVRRKKGDATTLKPWITLNQSGIASTAVQPSYNGEENTSQATFSIVNINGQSISANAASEAFDEGLTEAQVLAIVTPFFA